MKPWGAAILLILLALYPAWAGERKPGKPSPKDRCPVCGMFVAKYPDFLAQIIFEDGSRFFFDGAKDLFKYYFQTAKYDPARKKKAIEMIYVTDYYSLAPIDGMKAFFILGSDVYGPMGRELIPFAHEADAREFMKDHKGQALLRFNEIHIDKIKPLD